MLWNLRLSDTKKSRLRNAEFAGKCYGICGEVLRICGEVLFAKIAKLVIPRVSEVF